MMEDIQYDNLNCFDRLIRNIIKFKNLSKSYLPVIKLLSVHTNVMKIIVIIAFSSPYNCTRTVFIYRSREKCVSLRVFSYKSINSLVKIYFYFFSNFDFLKLKILSRAPYHLLTPCFLIVIQI